MITTGALLRTKLYVPRAHPNLVPRPRLGELLNEGMERKLTLISAPAGFGKTTLLSEWRMIHLDSEYPLAWVSLEEADNDPVRFLSYLIAALQAIEAEVGEALLSSLRSPQAPPLDSTLTALVNEIASIPKDFALALDDYHLIADEVVHGTLAFLLDHLPLQAHLVIASRVDPPLALARLRGQGQMTEIRTDDLRFTPEETTAFLRGTMGLDLPEESVIALEERTEGWITGLQLAALSMRGRQDISGFIAALKGSSRYVLDYLAEEVLRRQPEDIGVFLLQTSILDRLSGPLCDAVTDRADGQEMLERLERANLFTISLDDERRWYRYHHLFAEFLRDRLHQTQPEQEPELHRKASSWYEHNGLVHEAVDHALAAADLKTTARLIEENFRDMLAHGEAALLLSWMEALPEELVRSRPWLCIPYAWALVITGQLEAAELRGQELERMVDTNLSLPADEREITLSDKELAAVSGEAAAIRAFIVRNRGDVPLSIELSRRALELVSEDNLTLRGIVAYLLAGAYSMSGDLTAAKQSLSEAITTNQRAGNAFAVLLAMRGLAELEVIRGRLHRAADLYRQALRLAEQRPFPAAGLAYVGMGELLYEWDDLDGAMRHLTEGIALGEQSGSTSIILPGHALLARVKWARGDPEGAHRVIQDDETAAQGMTPSSRDLNRIVAYGARLTLAQGGVGGAARLLEERGIGVNDDLDHLNVLEHVMLARVLIARREDDAALDLLERLLGVAEATGSMGSAIEILAVEALAFDARGDEARAMAALGRALSLADPESYVRTFVDEGEPMATLLQKWLRAQRKEQHSSSSPQNASPEYARKLLAAFRRPSGSRALGTGADASRTSQPLPEPLSERELEVLRLIAAGKSNREISGQLFVTVDTVKKHLTHIFGKLGVRSRTQAVVQARELGLIP
ncbi:MAG: LuxR C-terminal-related transcriptional regulator [Actinomycetota bacterium]|nr:LuxR C-terminal-related transcriptional regulator [Actinomycetota bacterium]